MNGYIKLHRQLLESDIWQRPPWMGKLWLWMLLQAAHKPVKGLETGQFKTTRNQMRNAISWTENRCVVTVSSKSITRALNVMRNLSMITTRTVDYSYMIVSICNWDTYQSINSNHVPSRVPTPVPSLVPTVQEVQRKKLTSASSCTPEINCQPSAARALVDEWNRRFPKTCHKMHSELIDQNAMAQMLEDGLTEDDIHRLMDYVDVGYFSRPCALVRKSEQGNGPPNYIKLQLQMESKGNGHSSTTGPPKSVEQILADNAKRTEAFAKKGRQAT